MEGAVRLIDGPSPSRVLTKAVVRAGEHLSINNAVMARIIGVSPSTITRMKKGQYVLDPAEKAFELSALFVRVYRALDAIVGGDHSVATKWLTARNNALEDEPMTLIQTIRGLTRVLTYLDARRAVV